MSKQWPARARSSGVLGTWWILLFDGASTDKVFLGKVYWGYQLTLQGSFIGLLWTLADGFFRGAIVAWLYNLFAGAQVAKQDD